MNKYYTYAYLREDKTPYYVGKGSGKRLYVTQDRVISPPKDKSRIIFLKQNLTEEEAFTHEVYMISLFGRKDLGTGILHNKTNGGEGTSGKKYTLEELEKRALTRKKLVMPEEAKRKLSEAHKGKKLDNEHKKKIAEGMRKYYQENLDRKEKQSKTLKGKRHTEETKEKIRNAAILRWNNVKKP